MSQEDIERENRHLRRLLGLALGSSISYRDDGEFSDSSEMPHIDFMRDPVSDIEAKIAARNRKRMQRFKSIDQAIEHSKNWCYTLYSDRFSFSRPLDVPGQASQRVILEVKHPKEQKPVYVRTVDITVSKPDQRFQLNNDWKNDWLDISQKTAMALCLQKELLADIANKGRGVYSELEQVCNKYTPSDLYVNFSFQ